MPSILTSMHRWTTFLLLLLLISSPLSHSWGDVGHKTVAAIAENYLTDEAQAYVQGILFSNEYMTSVASWADKYRYTAKGRFSEPFHFIDAKDQPPASCSVSYARDCKRNTCIVSAIMNYTERIQKTTLPADATNEALKFLIHFVGDITQPLHDEAEAGGGNGINVTWNGLPKKLHGVWDTDMVERYAGGWSASVIARLAATLTDKIDTGVFPDAGEWIACVDPTTAEDCALDWATDANGFNCAYVLKTDVSGLELNGTYYDGAQPIIEAQIAKGGYRLGQYLNKLAASATRTARRLELRV